MKIDNNAENGNLNQIREEVLRWMANEDIGVSSKTIAATIAEVDCSHVDVPHDPSDFMRCLKMLDACPSIKNLSKVKEVYPFYAPIINNWNEMVDLLEKDKKEYSGRSPTLYKYMQKRGAESTFLKGRILNGITYMDVDLFEKQYNVKVTMENLHDCIKMGKTRCGL